MLLKYRPDNKWKRRFAIFPTEINDNGDLVWLGWYEVRGPWDRREYRLPGASESIIKLDA
jgi:hypothetical protein